MILDVVQNTPLEDWLIFIWGMTVVLLIGSIVFYVFPKDKI